MGSRSPWRVAVPLVLALAGVLMASSAATARGTDLRAERRTELADLVRERSRQTEQRVAEVGRLRAEVDRLTEDLGADDAEVREARAAANAAGAAAGTVPLTGPGLAVTLDDAPREPGTALPEGVSTDDLVVHQQDVQAVVNALWAGGARGVQVMDQRLVSTSAVRCVGNTLILQGRVYSPPFRISAVGDVAGMAAALRRSPQLVVYRQWVDAVGLGYAVEQRRTLTLPGFTGTLRLSYARVPE